MSPYAPAFIMTKTCKEPKWHQQDIHKYAMEQSYTGILGNNENECTGTTISIPTTLTKTLNIKDEFQKTTYRTISFP